MQYLKTYLKKLSDQGKAGLAESVKKTAKDIGESKLRTFSFRDHEIGLLFGNVQSGKTAQTFGIICEAADYGFSVFILLTTDNVALHKQTLDRVKSDLNGFCICGESDSQLFVENRLTNPTIVVLKKNARILRHWSDILGSTGFMRGNALFIIDDEADASSLNTLINRNRQSAINKYLDKIKKDASCSIYLQVTGTPQALFLQTVASGWHPNFVHYFEPGDEYLGGDFFFPISGKPGCIFYLDAIEDSVRIAVVRHLAVSAQIMSSGGDVSNCLFHPSVKVDEHNKTASEIKKEIDWCRENLEDKFRELLAEQYEDLNPTKSEKKSFESIYSYARELLKEDKIKVLIMNGKTDVDSTEYSKGCCFIVGGNTLSRGITFPSLNTIYYSRTSKAPQADTMWQHSRMFGYDRDPGLMKVFIGETLYKLFADINATNNSIIAQIERGIEKVKVHYPNGLNPTRKNVLDNRRVKIISGGANYFPSYPDNDSIETISEMLAHFSESVPSYQVSLRLIKELLTHIIPSQDFNMKAFQSVLDTILSENPGTQGILIVRRNRDVTQGTGALLSSDDWQLGRTFPGETVLTMYQVTGKKGWGGKPLWVPNIRLPDDMIYYDVSEDDTNPETD